MQKVLAEPAVKGAGRCPLLRAKRGSFDFFLVQKAHLIIIIVTKNEVVASFKNKLYS